MTHASCFPQATIELLQSWSEEFPAPRVRGGSVLYLDFDGVLHSHSVYVSRKKGIHFGHEALENGKQIGHIHRLFEHAELLSSLLDPYPQVRIVLSTTWAQKGGGYAQAKKRLPQQLGDRCIGATFHRGMNLQLFRQASRGMQVYADVCRRRPEQWLAVDDDYQHWPAFTKDFFVRTDENLGISAPHVLRELTGKLAQVFG